jgi:hypothetical protein
VCRAIARCFSRLQLLRGATSITDPIERRALHGFYPARSGDVVMVAEPYKYIGETITATHGSPYSYDTHVPTIIMGAGVNPGQYSRGRVACRHRADVVRAAAHNAAEQFDGACADRGA